MNYHEIAERLDELEQHIIAVDDALVDHEIKTEATNPVEVRLAIALALIDAAYPGPIAMQTIALSQAVLTGEQPEEEIIHVPAGLLAYDAD